ncbi:MULTISPECIES: GTPase Era [Desulfococcus]|jgi:GTP-binding protein Era|uniref:GTPase Era n=1 Tax=Desulfococcus multivorans DSM 2059 TaxID=1121405 RepID=S7TSR4_DESML|nr:GTPase Era [Desulfococcus multivorans]AOY60567.1 Era: GTP-binding protein [Desulfococcus multivorans]AQV02664.1 GTPase Era [Desulfococcus multivorans]EPR39725.1 GTP-binding protein Era-like-protein [Desulfococcus multivorans DSM 2059]MDX9818072.1 GTPase Era [Desulfococcus multivorans]SKA04783.1 GTP-binding protein Era [Desulfococcus multivorans DSM 2059]
MREDRGNRFKGFRSGFVMLAGAPNVGKSTLLNRMLGEKVSITSRKAQTTRNRILGVLHQKDAQLIFLDTPGVHKATQALNVRMVDVALAAMADADLILFMVDLKSPDPDAETFLLEKIRQQQRPAVLALNKTDQVRSETVLQAIDHWRTTYPFQAVVPISAKHGHQVDALIREMADLMPEGPPFFPEDAVTDMPERFIAAEMIREKVFRLTGQEIPYATAVTVESFKEKEGLVSIHATIHVERSSQKAIVIGREGAKLKQIGRAAREELERMMGTRVFLKLFVRVQKNWSRDTRALRKFGY